MGNSRSTSARGISFARPNHTEGPAVQTRANGHEGRVFSLWFEGWDQWKVARMNADAVTGNGSSDAAYPVIVGVDGSFVAIRAARWAAAVADRLDAPLQLVHAAENATRQTAEVVLQSAEDAVRRHVRGVRMTRTFVDGSPGKVLTELSMGARLVVIGSRESSSSSAYSVTATAMAVAGDSTCPVVAWRGERVSPSHEPIVVGVDHDRHSRVAITAAFEFANRFGVGITAVHAYPGGRPPDVNTMTWYRAESEARERLTTALMPWMDIYPNVEVTTNVESTLPGAALLHASHGAQLVVVGSRAAGNAAGVRLGSVGLELLQRSPIPVMFCRSADEAPLP